MNGIYITINNIGRESDGVAKKSVDQINSLQDMAGRVSSLFLAGNFLVLKEGNKIYKKKLPHKYFFLYSVIDVLRDFGRLDFVYIRNPHGGLHAIWLSYLCRRIRRFTNQIILDVPHYPYDSEEISIKGKISSLTHRINRPFLKKFVDVVIYTGEFQKEIWGVKAIRVKNSIDLSRVRPRQLINDEANTLNFLGVANLANWHGYDRLIRGVAEFYKSESVARQITFFIVGAGEPEVTKLKNLSQELGISERIRFLGPLSGDQLDSAFDLAHIGVDALGRHRSGNNYNDSIKSKEYCARGIPFIKSHEDDSFDNVDFVLTVAPAESAINIKEVINWFDSMKISQTQIRDFAQNNFTWKQQYERLFLELGLQDAC